MYRVFNMGIGLVLVVRPTDVGLVLSSVDEAILIPSQSTARIQEAHILIGHIFCEIVELELNLA